MELEPLTAREALWAIVAELDPRVPPAELFARVEQLAKSGLDQSALSNFELVDQLADHLAEAHRALGFVKKYLYGGLPDGDNEIEGLVNEALVLPPDLETIVERRMG